MGSGGTKWEFTTYERDSESGNDYARARHGANRLGRFLQRDAFAGTTGRPQSLNRYTYVENNPTNATDPEGLWIGLKGDCDPMFDFCLDGGDNGDGGRGDGPCGGLGFVDGQCPQSPPPPPPPPPPEPHCSCEMWYRPVKSDPNDPLWAKILLKLAGPTHSFWHDQDGAGQQWILSGGPTGPHGTGYLKGYASVYPGGYAGPDLPYRPVSKRGFDAGMSFQNCFSASAQIYAAQAWPPNLILYSPYPGPNSNTFAHYLAYVGGFTVKKPSGGYGWDWKGVGLWFPSN